MQRLLDINEAANYLGVAVPTVRKWTNKKQIAHIRLGKRVLFSEEGLRQHVSQCEVKVKSND